MVPAMRPADAYAHMAHREVERVPVDRLDGRVTGVLLTPYPPGIPLLIPGERFNRDIVDYLKFTQDFNQQFPGLDTDVHGLAYETDEQGRRHDAVHCTRAAGWSSWASGARPRSWAPAPPA